MLAKYSILAMLTTSGDPISGGLTTSISWISGVSDHDIRVSEGHRGPNEHPPVVHVSLYVHIGGLHQGWPRALTLVGDIAIMSSVLSRVHVS